MVRSLARFQKPFAIRAIRGFGNISWNAASALALFLQHHLAIRNQYDLYKDRKGMLPEGVYKRFEEKLTPESFAHPAQMKRIQWDEVATQEEADSIASSQNIYMSGTEK